MMTTPLPATAVPCLSVTIPYARAGRRLLGALIAISVCFAFAVSEAAAQTTEEPGPAPAFETMTGSVATFGLGVPLFSNRPYKIEVIPEPLRGARFVQAPIEQGQSFVCTRDGVLYVITPEFRRIGSRAAYLKRLGFEQLPEPSFIPYGKNEQDRSVVFRKQVKTGEVIRATKWMIIAAQGNLELDLVTADSRPWDQNTGETLYNGIVLPKIWPPVTISTQAKEPMPVPYLQHPPKVVSIDVGRQLFVDDFLVEQTDLRRRYHAAKKYEGNPVMKAETPGELAPGEFESSESATVFLGHGGVFYDPTEQLFKMFYTAGWRGGIAMATSRDLIKWDRPELGIAGGNLFLARGPRWSGPKLTTGGSDNAMWLDLEAPPAERLKYLTCWMHAPSRPPGFHHSLHASSDGRQWTDAVPVEPAAEDYSSFFYNPFRKKWVFSMKTHSAAGRSRNYFESDEFLKGGDQTEAVYWTYADTRDLPEPAGAYPGAGDKPQLYSLNAVAYESIMVGMHYIHRGPSNEVCVRLGIPKLTDLELGFSRDGFHWDRPDRTGFIRGERKEGTWDRAYLHGTTGVFVVMGDKLVFPYMGVSGVAPDGKRGLYTGGSIGIATLRRDGFASMEADRQGGTLVTRPLRFSGQNFFVNAATNAGGGLRAEIIDEKGEPVAPFTFANSVTFSGDSTLTEMRWRGADNLSALAGKPVRVRFHLIDGSLYSFWVSKDQSGRSDGYVAAGGPGYPGTLDTVGKAALEAVRK